MSKTNTKAVPKVVEDARRISKIDILVAMLRVEHGADMPSMALATSWQHHSVRGAISGQIKKKLALTVVRERVDGRTVYRIPQHG